MVHLLEVMTGPQGMVPVEEEEITAETATAVDKSRSSLARGEGTPHEDIRREFGLDQ